MAAKRYVTRHFGKKKDGTNFNRSRDDDSVPRLDVSLTVTSTLDLASIPHPPLFADCFHSFRWNSFSERVAHLNTANRTLHFSNKYTKGPVSESTVFLSLSLFNIILFS